MRLAFLAAAAMLSASLAAHADTLTTFALAARVGTPSGVSSFSGTIIYDGTTGMFSGGNVSGVDDNVLVTFTGVPVDTTPIPGVIQVLFTDPDRTFFQFQVEGTEIPDGGGPLCTSICGGVLMTNGYPSYFSFSGGPELPITEGTLTSESTVVTPPNAVTPEPSSIALLGTGMLGLAGVIRKRFAA